MGIVSFQNSNRARRKMAVGSTLHSTPQAEIMGKEAAKEHFPTRETSLIARICILLPSFFGKFL
jgi:hypothetical protein